MTYCVQGNAVTRGSDVIIDVGEHHRWAQDLSFIGVCKQLEHQDKGDGDAEGYIGTIMPHQQMSGRISEDPIWSMRPTHVSQTARLQGCQGKL